MAKKYVQQFELGSGAFGRAVVVKNTDIHEVFVAKIIQVKNLSEVELDRCVTEVLILKSCNHRNIIQYIEAFVEQECLHIVMEYARGGDLHHKIQTQNTLGRFFTCDEILQWFIQIVLALEYIHSKSILHRDLKPQNVFLTENSIIKLGDFGIAKILAHGDDLASTRIGTPFYISPEICAGKQYNSSSDMWAAGCLLFELTLLRVPFNAASLSALTKNIIQCQFDQIPRSFGNVIPKLISQLIVFEPERRLSATEILKCPDVIELVAHYRKLNPDIKKVRRSSSVRSLGGREVRKSVEATNPAGFDAVKDTRPEGDKCNKKRVAKSESKAPDSRNDSNERKDKKQAVVKDKPLVGEQHVGYNDQADSGRQAAKHVKEDTSEVKAKSCAKIKPRTFSLKDSVVRKLSAASPKLAETIRKQRMSVGDEKYIKDQSGLSNVETEDINNDVFTPEEVEPGSKRQRKGSLTYTVLKPRVCFQGLKSNDENNNASTSEINSTLLLALSMLKSNRELAKTILMDRLAYSVGQKRGEELVKTVKQLVIEDGQTYQDIQSKLLKGEDQYIPLVSMILCLNS